MLCNNKYSTQQSARSCPTFLQVPLETRRRPGGLPHAARNLFCPCQRLCGTPCVQPRRVAAALLDMSRPEFHAQ
jgi:hypothetical protein